VQHVVIPVGFTVVLSVAAGLGALLALEHGTRRGDATACALLVLSLATFSIGLAFLVGIAISILARSERWRRAWVFVLPLGLYAAWWLWATDTGDAGEGAQLANALLIPNYIADSLAAVMGALAGLNYDFSNPSPEVVSDTVELRWGRVLAVIAAVGLALRIRRGNVPPSLWCSLGIVLTYWALGALVVSDLRPPALERYMYMGAIGVLLVATDSAREVGFSKLGLTLLFAACAFSLATNIAHMRDGAASFRNTYSPGVRAELAMFELARDNVGRDFPRAADPELLPDAKRAAAYLATVDRFGGSAGFSTGELERQSESVRASADRVLADTLGVRLAPPPVPSPEDRCLSVTSDGPGPGVGFELPRGGAVLRARANAPAALTLGRFADTPSVERGTLSPGEPVMLEIPPDASPRPWRAVVGAARSVEVCPIL
jgi:hypothetical protein